MAKVVVIGGGASGIIASLLASKNNEVVLLEANDKLGKKILITGNGKCNYWNSDIDCKNYRTDSVNNLSTILENKDRVFSYLTSLGICPKIKNGYYYPNSNQAASIVEIFNREIVNHNVKIMYNCKVNGIKKIEDKFVIFTNTGEITADKIILSTGSCAYPKTGSTGDSYEILKNYHTINKVLPALVPLECEGNFFKDWTNLRIDGSISLQVDDKILDSEIGEIQLTDYGVSGIPVFNISGLASKNLYLGSKVNIIINFLPGIDFNEWFKERNRSIPNHTVLELMESLLPYQLVFVLLKKAGIKKDDKWDNLSEETKRELAMCVNNLTLKVVNTLSFDRGQVVTGGISLLEINPNTMESLKIKDLYLTGELLDVDGKCGGFNLGFAFISGYIAGKNV